MDISTLYFASALVALVVAGATWLGNGLSGRHTGLRALLLANLALAAALALLGLRGSIDDWLSQGFGDTLLFASALLYRIAVDRLFQREEWERTSFAVAGIGALAVWGAIIGDAPDTVRAVVGSVATAAALSLPAWALLTGDEPWRGRTRFLAGTIFLVGALAALGRAFALGMDAVPVALVEPASVNLLLALTVLGLVTAASFSFLVMLREREQERLALLDALTETLNRRAFVERAEAVLSLARRRDLSCSLVLLDLDQFERINDAYGYAAGDRVLRHVADLLRKVLRREDVLGRSSGDEFTMLLFATPMAGGQALAQRISTALEAHPPRIRQAGVTVSACFGVAEWTHGSELTLDDLLHRADRARQAAKRQGSGSIARADQLRN